MRSSMLLLGAAAASAVSGMTLSSYSSASSKATTTTSANPNAFTNPSNPCEHHFNNCLNLGNPLVYCQCNLASCEGEDDAADRSYCNTATAHMTINSATGTKKPASSSASATAAPYAVMSKNSTVVAPTTSKNVTIVTLPCSTSTGALATGTGAAKPTQSVESFKGDATHVGASAALALMAGVFAFLA